MNSPSSLLERLAAVRHLAGAAIADYAMIPAGSRIVVGVSGGKDSLILMHVLEQLRRRAPIEFTLFPTTIDMGFPKVDLEGLETYARRQRWPLEVVRLPGQELLRNHEAEDRPCSLCARLRRGRLYAAADRHGATLVALGHHLDDLCTSFLISLYRGAGLKTMGPNVPADGGRKRIIRPLCRVPERLLARAAAALDLPEVQPCPYHQSLDERGDRAYVRRMLDRLAGQFPGVRSAMLRSMQDLRPEHLLDRRFLAGRARPGRSGAAARPGRGAASAPDRLG
jgi:tRNA 2-thiocytidine biosynthesis protein TtcA